MSNSNDVPHSSSDRPTISAVAKLRTEMLSGAQPSNELLSRLVALLTHQNPDVRLVSAIALSTPRQLPSDLYTKLLPSLGDESNRVRFWIAAALRKGNPDLATLPTIIATLKEYLLDPRCDLRRYSCDLLANLGEHAFGACAIISMLVSHPDSALAIAATSAFTRIGCGDEEAKHKLMSNLVMGPPLLRIASARALGSLGSVAVDAVPLLQNLLADTEWAVRFAAAEALTLITGNAQECMAELINGLLCNQRPVRVRALYALARLGRLAEPAVEEIRCVACEDDEELAAVAQSLLLTLRSEKGGAKRG